jgi:hypothetical protein
MIVTLPPSFRRVISSALSSPLHFEFMTYQLSTVYSFLTFTHASFSFLFFSLLLPSVAGPEQGWTLIFENSFHLVSMAGETISSRKVASLHVSLSFMYFMTDHDLFHFLTARRR